MEDYLLSAKAGLLNSRHLSTRKKTGTLSDIRAVHEGGIPVLTMLGSQNAIGGKPSFNFNFGIPTNTTFIKPNTAKETEFIKPNTAKETGFIKPSTEFIKPQAGTNANLHLKSTETNFIPKGKKVSINESAMEKALEKTRENTKAPKIEPPYNLPEESKLQSEWFDYIKTRYGKDAGRLEKDKLLVDQQLYNIAKQTWKEANKTINDFRYLENSQGNTEEQEEAINNFGAFFMDKIFSFVFNKVKDSVLSGIRGGADALDKAIGKELGNEFLNGLKSGIQFLVGADYKDTVRDIQKLQHELFKFNPNWRISMRRKLQEITENLPGSGGSAPPPGKKLPPGAEKLIYD